MEKGGLTYLGGWRTIGSWWGGAEGKVNDDGKIEFYAAGLELLRIALL